MTKLVTPLVPTTLINWAHVKYADFLGTREECEFWLLNFDNGDTLEYGCDEPVVRDHLSHVHVVQANAGFSVLWRDRDADEVATYASPVVAWKITEFWPIPVALDLLPKEYALRCPDGRVFDQGLHQYESTAAWERASDAEHAERVAEDAADAPEILP